MSKTKWLIGIFVVLLLFLGMRIYAHWGLITIHANDEPLAKVIGEIESQGGITLKTNFDAKMKINMNVDLVPLTSALDALADAAGGHWQLTYLFGPNKTALETGIATVTNAEPSDAWKMVYFRLRMPFAGANGEAIALPDPRGAVWNVSAPKDATLQAYAEEAAHSVNSGFYFPADWNPAISSPPASGAISKLAQKLANAANGASKGLFLLLQREQRAPEAKPDTAEKAPSQNDDWRDVRVQNEVARLPSAQRKAVQKQIDERKAFRKLSPEERRKKMEALFHDPARMQKMEDRWAQRMDQKTPEQKQKMFQHLVDRKMAVKGGGQ